MVVNQLYKNPSTGAEFWHIWELLQLFSNIDPFCKLVGFLFGEDIIFLENMTSFILAMLWNQKSVVSATTYTLNHT